MAMSPEELAQIERARNQQVSAPGVYGQRRRGENTPSVGGSDLSGGLIEALIRAFKPGEESPILGALLSMQGTNFDPGQTGSMRQAYRNLNTAIPSGPGPLGRDIAGRNAGSARPMETRRAGFAGKTEGGSFKQTRMGQSPFQQQGGSMQERLLKFLQADKQDMSTADIEQSQRGRQPNNQYQLLEMLRRLM